MFLHPKNYVVNNTTAQYNNSKYKQQRLSTHIRVKTFILQSAVDSPITISAQEIADNKDYAKADHVHFYVSHYVGIKSCRRIGASFS